MNLKRKIATALIGVLAAAFTVGIETPAHAAEGYYRIINFGSGKCAEPNRFGDPRGNGEPVLQWTCDGSARQAWHPFLHEIGTNHWVFVNRDSSKCLDVRDGRNADRTPIQQWDCRGGASMIWDLNPNSFTGVHQLISHIGSRCLDVAAGSLEEGAQIQIYRCTGFGNPAQVWYFEPVP
jgi:hypothetical protein